MPSDDLPADVDPDVTADLADAREATGRLLAHLDGLAVADLRAPSLLPGWTRAHVVAHLAGNALSHVRLLEGCLTGVVRDQYEGGSPARAAGIEALAADPARALAEHRDACERLERCWAQMTGAHWTREVRWLDAPAPSPAAQEPRSRRREVEVHGVDLDTGFEWPAAFAADLLDELAARPDLPALVLAPTDGPRRGAGGPVVAGTVDALARWLAGRSDGADLTTGSGEALPQLPAWR